MNFLDFPLNGTTQFVNFLLANGANESESPNARTRVCFRESACGAQECLPLCDKVIHKSNCVDTELKINNFHTVVVHLTTLGRQSGP